MSTRRRRRYLESAPKVLVDYLEELRPQETAASSDHRVSGDLLEKLIADPLMNTVWAMLSSLARKAKKAEEEAEALYKLSEYYEESEDNSAELIARAYDSVSFDFFQIVCDSVSNFSPLDQLSPTGREERLEELSKALVKSSRLINSLSLNQNALHNDAHNSHRMNFVLPTDVFEQLGKRVEEEKEWIRLTSQDTDDAACIYFQRWAVAGMRGRFGKPMRPIVATTASSIFRKEVTPENVKNVVVNKFRTLC